MKASSAASLAASIALVLAAVACSKRSEPPAARDVRLLTLDTTRADRLGPWGSALGATPHLDALAAQGAVFLDATTSSPLTRPAHTTLLTGVSPLRPGVRDNVGYRVPDGVKTLAARLSAAGFGTRAVVAASVLARDSGLDRGFDAYDDDLGERAERPAAEVAERALAALDGSAERRSFLWLHFYDPHLPHDAEARWRERFPGDGYAAELAQMDDGVGRVLDELRKRGRLDSTLVVAVADHGEALGEHGEPDHGVFLYQSTLHVPLIVRAAGRAADRVATLARDVDVVPTILDALGLDPAPELEGRSLLGAREGAPAERTAYAESFYARDHYGWAGLRALRDRRYKYVASPRPELYDLQEDPGETRNLAVERQPLADAMAARLAQLSAGSAAGAREAVASEAVERLRSLGYVGASLPEAEASDGPAPRDRVASLALFAEVVPRALECLEERACQAGDVGALDRVLAAEPRYVEGHVLKAKLLSRLGRAREAIAAMEAALRLNPRDTAILADLADLRAGAGDLAGGLELLAAARAESPADGDLVTRESRLLRAAGRDEEALARLRDFATAHPGEPLARYELGCALLERGDVDGAEQAIRAAFAISPGLDRVHFNLALIAEARGRIPEAREEYRKELARRPRNFEAWTNLGLLELEHGAPEAAAEAARRVMELEPRLFAGPWLLARARLAAGGRADAEVLALARRAVELAPDSEAARELLARVRREVQG